MIVYVETNFVLEIACGQQKVVSANKILTLAEEGKMKTEGQVGLIFTQPSVVA